MCNDGNLSALGENNDTLVELIESFVQFLKTKMSENETKWMLLLYRLGSLGHGTCNLGQTVLNDVKGIPLCALGNHVFTLIVGLLLQTVRNLGKRRERRG